MIRLIMAVALLAVLPIQAKRIAPKPVKPVQLDGVEFRAPLDASSIGVVEAWHLESGKKLWKQTLYKIDYDKDLERDVQWVFIRKLELIEGRLIVTNEAGHRWSVHPKTGKARRLDEKK